MSLNQLIFKNDPNQQFAIGNVKPTLACQPASFHHKTNIFRHILTASSINPTNMSQRDYYWFPLLNHYSVCIDFKRYKKCSQAGNVLIYSMFFQLNLIEHCRFNHTYLVHVISVLINIQLHNINLVNATES
jgi:hypothetical protein